MSDGDEHLWTDAYPNSDGDNFAGPNPDTDDSASFYSRGNGYAGSNSDGDNFAGFYSRANGYIYPNAVTPGGNL